MVFCIALLHFTVLLRGREKAACGKCGPICHIRAGLYHTTFSCKHCEGRICHTGAYLYWYHDIQSLETALWGAPVAMSIMGGGDGKILIRGLVVCKISILNRLS